MSYAQYNTVQATDFNALLGANPTTAANTLNAVWATGGGSAGYGQTTIATVSSGGNIRANTQWSNLVNYTANAATHQGTSIPSVVPPASGGVITYLSSLPSNLTSIYTNRLNAAAQGSTSNSTVSYGTTWSNSLTFTFNVSFANGDAARYFFNSGGQLSITASHPSGSGINQLFNYLASNIGNVVLSAPSTGSATIVSKVYNGVTQVGGSGNTPTISTNSGYYGLTASNTVIFTQTAATGPSSYLNSNISITAKTNGTQGSNSDNGSIITIYVTWNELPTGLTASSGSTTVLTLTSPETTTLANTWGTTSITGTVTGS